LVALCEGEGRPSLCHYADVLSPSFAGVLNFSTERMQRLTAGYRSVDITKYYTVRWRVVLFEVHLLYLTFAELHSPPPSHSVTLLLILHRFEYGRLRQN